MYTARRDARAVRCECLHQKWEGVRTVRQRVDLGRLALAPVNPRQTSQSVHSINVHGAGSANSLSAGSTESQCWVEVVLDLDLCPAMSMISPRLEEPEASLIVTARKGDLQEHPVP